MRVMTTDLIEDRAVLMRRHGETVLILRDDVVSKEDAEFLDTLLSAVDVLTLD